MSDRRWVLAPDRLALEAALRIAQEYLVDSDDGRDFGLVVQILVDRQDRVLGVEACGGWFGRRRRSFDLRDVVAVSPYERRIVVARGSTSRDEPGRG